MMDVAIYLTPYGFVGYHLKSLNAMHLANVCMHDCLLIGYVHSEYFSGECVCAHHLPAHSQGNSFSLNGVGKYADWIL